MIASAKSKSASDRPTCVVPGCTRQVYSRGLCVPCNRAARKLVESGEATWEELESMNPPLALPKKSDQVNALVAAFRKAKERQAYHSAKLQEVNDYIKANIKTGRKTTAKKK